MYLIFHNSDNIHNFGEKKKLIKSKDFDLRNNVMQKAYSEKVGLHFDIFQH